MAACGAAAEIGMFGKTTIVGANHQLRGFRHHVDRAPAPVVDLAWMADGEFQVIARMTGIGAGGGVAVGESLLHDCEIQRSGIAAVACTFEFSVPAFGVREPDFEMNFRIRYGL